MEAQMTRVPGRHVRWLAVIGTAALLMLGIGALLGARPGQPAAQGESVAATVPARQVDELAAEIDRYQARLKEVPGDYVTWASLGVAYLSQGRVSADPSYYPKAEGALKRSLALRSTDNTTAMAGLGALANSRHDFAGARGWAMRAIKIDPYDVYAYTVLTDAQTQLGNAVAATNAAQRALDLRPGLAAETRASYDLELHGRMAEAEQLMRDALDDATDPADIAFCRYQLGELAWQAGRLADAASEYTAGLSADPSYLPLLEGQAKLAAARGETDAAIAGYANLTQRYPTPGYLMEYAELLRATGHAAQANAQLDLAGVALQLFTANGGGDYLAAAQLAIYRGDAAGAVQLARREWQRRHFVDVADTLGWALHLAGEDREALTYAHAAVSLGGRPARYSYHLGAIEAALGDRVAARRDLRLALAANPEFSPLDGPAAAQALSTVES
jgi:tetratricopeptide (TPR) repeat protein